MNLPSLNESFHLAGNVSTSYVDKWNQVTVTFTSGAILFMTGKVGHLDDDDGDNFLVGNVSVVDEPGGKELYFLGAGAGVTTGKTPPGVEINATTSCDMVLRVNSNRIVNHMFTTRTTKEKGIMYLSVDMDELVQNNNEDDEGGPIKLIQLQGKLRADGEDISDDTYGYYYDDSFPMVYMFLNDFFIFHREKEVFYISSFSLDTRLRVPETSFEMRLEGAGALHGLVEVEPRSDKAMFARLVLWREDKSEYFSSRVSASVYGYSIMHGGVSESAVVVRGLPLGDVETSLDIHLDVDSLSDWRVNSNGAMLRLDNRTVLDNMFEMLSDTNERYVALLLKS